MPQPTDALPETEQLQRAADILRTVAHPARLRIIDFLEQGENSVTEIRRRLEAPQPYVSQQLNIMKARGVLSSRRNGTQVYYSIANRNVVEVIHCVRRHAGPPAQTGGGCVRPGPSPPPGAESGDDVGGSGPGS